MPKASPMSTTSAKKCHQVRVPSNACVLVFSDELSFDLRRTIKVSARGEELWAPVTRQDGILEIELLGDDKPLVTGGRVGRRSRWFSPRPGLTELSRFPEFPSVLLATQIHA